MSAADNTGERQNDGAGAPKRPDQFPKEVVEITRIEQRWRTFRVLIICTTAVVGIKIIADALVEAVTEPKWWQLVGAIALALLAPSGVLAWLLNSRWKYVRKTHRRTAELEQVIDKRRSSSSDDRG